MNIQKAVEMIVIFAVLLAAFFLTNPMEKEPEIFPTITPIPTITFIPATETPLPLPTMTNSPPVVVPPIIPQADNGFDNAFHTAIVCENVPAYSQPAPNYNLQIGYFYKGNTVDVTGQSRFWARVSMPATGQVGYVPREYVAC